MRSNLVELEFSRARWIHGAVVAVYTVGLLQGLRAAFESCQSCIFWLCCVRFIFSVTNQMTTEQTFSWVEVAWFIKWNCNPTWSIWLPPHALILFLWDQFALKICTWYFFGRLLLKTSKRYKWWAPAVSHCVVWFLTHKVLDFKLLRPFPRKYYLIAVASWTRILILPK